MKALLYIFFTLFSFITLTAQNATEQDSRNDEKKESNEDEFFNSFVSQNTFNEFINSGTPSGNDPFTVVIPRVEVKGSKFLLNDWGNRATIKTSNNKQITISNINFELEAGTFALQNDKSVYLIDGEKYTEIFFNGVTFRNLNNSILNKRRFHEIIFENNAITLVKNYYLSVRESDSYAPGYGQKPGKTFVKKNKYYIVQDGAFIEFKLRKKSLFELFPTEKANIIAFVKKNKLSYSKEKDIKKILSSL